MEKITLNFIHIIIIFRSSKVTGQVTDSSFTPPHPVNADPQMDANIWPRQQGGNVIISLPRHLF